MWPSQDIWTLYKNRVEICYFLSRECSCWKCNKPRSQSINISPFLRCYLFSFPLLLLNVLSDEEGFTVKIRKRDVGGEAGWAEASLGYVCGSRFLKSHHCVQRWFLYTYMKHNSIFFPSNIQKKLGGKLLIGF